MSEVNKRKKIKKSKVPGQKNPFDTALKSIFSKKDNFASVFNTLCFKENKIDVSKLRDQNSVETVTVTLSDGTVMTLQLFRDCVMLHDDLHNFNLCVFCTENQNDIDYFIPVRNMLYDVLDYCSMADVIKHQHRAAGDCVGSGEFLSGFRRGDKLYPVFTLVIYYGEKPWDGPRSLKDILYPMSDELDAFVQDYKCTIIDIKELQESQVESLSEDLRVLLNLLRHTYNNTLKEYCTGNPELKNVSDDVSVAFSYASHNKKLQKYVDAELKKGGVDMESIFRRFEEDAIQKGKNEGMSIGWEKGKLEGKLEGKAEDVIRLLAHGFEAHNISMLLNIPLKDIDDIIHNNQDEISRITEEIKSENIR